MQVESNRLRSIVKRANQLLITERGCSYDRTKSIGNILFENHQVDKSALNANRLIVSTCDGYRFRYDTNELFLRRTINFIIMRSSSCTRLLTGWINNYHFFALLISLHSPLQPF